MKTKKVIRVGDLAAGKRPETRAMIAELESGIDAKWPVRFQSRGDIKDAGKRR